jgi:hypothetical protein
MVPRRIAAVIGAAALMLGALVGSGPATAGTAAPSDSLPTAVSWAMSTTRTTFRAPLAVEYLIQLNFLGNWIPIPPSDQDKVVLQRRAAGSTAWRPVATTAKTVTDKEGKPHYLLVGFRAAGNAGYRVVYNSQRDGVQSSTSTVRWLKVSRIMGDRGVNRSGRLYIVGNVDPGWGNRPVVFQRRACWNCAWTYYGWAKTGAYGGFQKRIYAPRAGVWRYRAYVRGTTDFIQSWTHTFIVRAPSR